jgi:hypothetical protein
VKALLKSLPAIEEKKTVDGLPVRVGASVWHAGAHGVRTCKLAKHHLGLWWPWFGKEIYSTESAALTAQIEREKFALQKAQREIKRATKAIERLVTRQKLRKLALEESSS